MQGTGIWDFLNGREAQLAIAVAVGVGLCLLAAYVVGKMRGKYRESDSGPLDMLTNFRELHAQGGLSDEEYRNIKAKLAAQFQQQLKESEKKG